MYSCSGAGLRRTCICVLCVQSFSCLAAREPESRSGTEQLASASASATVAFGVGLLAPVKVLPL